MQHTAPAAHAISRIVKTEYYTWPGTSVVICLLTLENGFNIRGESAVLDLVSFNETRGQEVARTAALSQLCRLESYLHAERQWQIAEKCRANAIANSLLGTPTSLSERDTVQMCSRQRATLNRLAQIEAILRSAPPHSTVKLLRAERLQLLEQR